MTAPTDEEVRKIAAMILNEPKTFREVVPLAQWVHDRLSAGSGWRAISEAPKDGTWFVAMRAGEDNSFEVGRYEQRYSWNFTEVGENPFRKEGQQGPGYEWMCSNSMGRMTYFMSLPSPPGEG